jgi:hypothetical protein
VLGPALSVQHCHCSRCRKLYASLYATGAVIERAKIRITGEENLTTYRSTPSFPDQFCRICGCRLFSYEDEEPSVMYYAPATLDGGIHPRHPDGKEAHTFTASKAAWERIEDSLPQYQERSPDEIVTGIMKR